MLEEQPGEGGVALEAAGVVARLEVQYDPFAPEADAEVLQAAVAASGLRQVVVELIAVDGGGVTRRGPQRGFAAAGSMVVSSTHQRALAPLSSTEPAATGASLEVVLLAVDVLQLPGLVAAALLADEHLDPEGEVQEAGVQVAGDPVPAGVDDAVRRVGGVVALMLALGSSVRCGLWLMAR